MDRRPKSDRGSAHSRQPSTLSTNFTKGDNSSLMTDPTRFQSARHIRQMSQLDTAHLADRRGSYHSDTTSRMFDRDARSIRVRASDIFGVRPKLQFRDDIEYRSMPDGNLPTLKGRNQSTFVDQIADELDTHQLRNVLDTDSRRRKRRQSALTSSRRQTRSLEPVRSAGMTTDTSARATSFTPAVEIIKKAPVSERQSHNRQNKQHQNLITGTADNWHDIDGLDRDCRDTNTIQQPGLILAGNRESFPDFAVVDRRDPVRDSGGGFLTTAWTSLWRRASTARSRKELDVAQHRTKTLQAANMQIVTERDEGAVVRDRSLGSNKDTDFNALDKHLSANSSVLYETLDDLKHAPVARIHNSGIDDEIPTDAFYDPRTTSRSASRATHSRNFSRPTNDSRQEFYGKSIDQITDESSKPISGRLFSPLLNGDSFPKPDERIVSNFQQSSDHQKKEPIKDAAVNENDRTHVTSVRTYSTAALAAGIQPSPTQPSRINEEVRRNQPTSAGKDLSPNIVIDGFASQGHSNQASTMSSVPNSLSNRASGLDALVRRSFSRSERDGDLPQNHHMQSKTGRPLSARSHMRDFVSANHGRENLSSSDQETNSPIDDDDDDDDQHESIFAQELEDEPEYEQGIWRTGIGRPVQIVNSTTENGPILVDRSQLGHSIPSSRRSSDTRKSIDDHPDLSLIRIESHHGKLETEHNQNHAPPLVQHQSYMTSVNSFYTANGHLTNESATASRETLTQDHFK